LSPVDRAPEFLVGEPVGGIPAGKISLRTYATNGNLDLTLTKPFIDKYQVRTGEKGRARLQVKGFQNMVHFTTNGLVMIFGGIGRDDEAILTALKQDIVTRDGRPFTWSEKSKVLGAPELQAQVKRLSQVLSDYATKFHG
jgi:hypothetical protein